MTGTAPPTSGHAGLYTPDQRTRRDATVWTLVQGILAPLQFVVFLLSLALVIRFVITGEGYGITTVSIMLKTALLFVIMITGAIWEKVVFGQWLFAPAFFWEDVISFCVIALHSIYLYGFMTGAMSPEALVVVVLAAYAAYVINAGQFLWKLRTARLQSQVMA